MEARIDKKSVLMISVLSSFLTPFMGASVIVALPSIGKHFALDAIVLSWVATSYLLAAAMFLVPMGRLADLYGRRRIFLYGIILDTIASLALAVSPSETWLIAFRAVQGVGGAMIFGTGVAILTSVFGPGERGRALGITVAAVYVGLSVGPLVGGFLTQQVGWRSIFLANVPLALIVIFLTITRLKGEWAEARGERFDFVGSVIYMSALVALMIGLSWLPAVAGGALIGVGVAGLAVFAGWELKTPNPVLHLDLFFRNPVFTLSNLAALVNYSATFAVGFLLSLYLQYIRHLPPQTAGLILLCQPVIQALFSPFAGRLSDWVEPRVVASIGMALTIAGLLPLSLLSGSTSPIFIIGCLVVLGFSFALFSSPNTNAIMSSVDRRFYGVASATLGTMRLVGQMLSMGIAMLIFALRLGPVKITPENHRLFLGSVRTAFVIFSILCLVGVLASLARIKVRGRSSGA